MDHNSDWSPVAGIVLGSGHDCEPVEAMVRDRLAQLGLQMVGELGLATARPT